MHKEKKLLYKIKKLCKKRCVRLTPQRLEVLRLISQQNTAISAYHLLNLLHQSSPQAKPPTIYRALNFLLSQGFIHKIESTNSFMICHHFSKHTHSYIFFICKKCQKVTEKTTNRIEIILKNIAKTTNFQIISNVVETHGICLKCTKHSL